MEEKKEQIGRGMNWISLSSPLRSYRSLVALSFQSFVHKLVAFLKIGHVLLCESGYACMVIDCSLSEHVFNLSEVRPSRMPSVLSEF